MIPVNTPLLNGNEKKYLNECIDTGWISSEGPFVQRFENNLASYVGRKFATACTSGTAALDIAVGILKLKEGDEVIMPSFTIISCAQALVNRGIRPVLVDSHIDTFNMIVDDVEPLITNKTKAIMVVHIYGLCVDMNPIIRLAKKYKLKIIEDAAEVLGQTYNGKKCGSFGDVSIFSFYPNKQITTGEGGMVLCDTPELDSRAKSLRNLCFTKERFVHEELGNNYRMTNMQAALGVAQLENIEQVIERKKWIGSTYNKLLADIPNIVLPIASTEYCENIYWVYTLFLTESSKLTAKQVMQSLSELNIGTRPFFFPMHQQPVFKNMGLFKEIRLTNSEILYEQGFYIPSGLGITSEEMKKVSDVLHEVLI